MWPSRGATRPRTDNDGRAGGRRPGWIGPGREGEGVGSGDAICAISPSSASRPPAIARQDAEGDAATALVIGFAGWEKNPRHSLEDGTEPAVQFTARAPTGLEGPGRMAPSRHAHARENYFAVRPNFSWQLDRRGSPRLAPSPLAPQQLELMFE